MQHEICKVYFQILIMGTHSKKLKLARLILASNKNVNLIKQLMVWGLETYR